MSKTRQISVTLPEDLIDTIRSAVDRGESRSVSSYIAARLEPGLVMESLFAEWDVDRGAPTSDDRAWAEGVLSEAFEAGSARSPDNAA